MLRIRSLSGRFDATGALRAESRTRFREAVEHAKAISLEGILWAVPIGFVLFLIGLFVPPVRNFVLQHAAALLAEALIPVLVGALAFLLVPVAILLNFIVAAHGGTRIVTATEFELDAEAAAARLEAGQLSPRDLVFENGAWRTLLDSSALGFQAELIVAAWARRRVFAMVLVVPLGMALLALIGVAISQVPDWIMRSAHD